MTDYLAISIQPPSYLKPRFRCNRLGQSGLMWGDGFGIHKCQKLCWQMNGAIGRCLPWTQWLWYTNCWLRKSLLGYILKYCEGIQLMYGWIWHGMTMRGFPVQHENGIHCRDWIQFLAGLKRSGQLQLCGIQCLLQPWNQSWWPQCLEW